MKIMDSVLWRIGQLLRSCKRVEMNEVQPDDFRHSYEVGLLLPNSVSIRIFHINAQHVVVVVPATIPWG